MHKGKTDITADKEIIVMEGDNDHFYNSELKDLSRRKKPK